MNRTSVFAIALVAATTLTACISGTESIESAAWQKCSTAPDKAARKVCMQTEEALLLAQSRDRAATANAERTAAEQRQAELEAQGIPRDAARQAADSGLKLPQ